MISIETRKEMYEYLLSDKKQGGKSYDSDFQFFIKEVIKDLSKKLFLKTELYLRKSIILRDNNYRIIRNTTYKFKSNKLIYDVLKELHIDYDYIDSEDDTRSKRIIEEQLSDVTYDECDEILESGSKDRIKLIRACKLYLNGKEIELVSNTKSDDKYNMAEESWLAETVLGKYSKELGIGAKSQSPFNARNNQPYAGQLKPDIIVYDKNNIIVIDCKVYKRIIEKNSKGTEKYISNNNRYQVNSYIGRCLDSDKYSSKKYKNGIILHIADKELYERCQSADGTDLTIEYDRPIKLYIIEDKGLNYILSRYKEIIDNTMNT